MLGWCLVGVAGVALASDNSLFQVEIPRGLYMEGGYGHKEAMFGTPKYGVTLTQRVYYTNSTFCEAPSSPSGGTNRRPFKPFIDG